MLDMLEDVDTAIIAIAIMTPPMMTPLFLPFQLVIYVSLWFPGFNGLTLILFICCAFVVLYAMLSRKFFCSIFPICFVCDSSGTEETI